MPRPGLVEPGYPEGTIPTATGAQTRRRKKRALGANRLPTPAEIFRPTAGVCYNDWRRAGGYQERGVMELARAAAESGPSIAVAR